MPLTQDFKNECQRILDAWKNLLDEKWAKLSTWKEWGEWIEDNFKRITDDPFFLSFKDRNSEEIKYFSKAVRDFYDLKLNDKYNTIWSDEKAPTKGMMGFMRLKTRLFNIIADSDKWDKTAELTQLTTDKATAEASLKSYKDNLGTETPEALKLKLATLAEAKAKAEQEATTAKQGKEQAEKDLTTFQNEAGKEVGSRNIKIGELEKEIKTLKEQQGKGDQYLNKLLAIYKAQITEATKTFYQIDLKLDESDDIRPKYKDKITEMGKDPENDDYTVLLDNLNGESEPEQVINAFKLLALVCATEKAVKESSEWMRTMAFKNKVLKANKLKYFQNIKNYWNRLKDLKPREENNPLYHKDIDKINKDFWIEQLNETIQLWQPQ